MLDRTISREQLNPVNIISKTAFFMVVFAMYICCNASKVTNFVPGVTKGNHPRGNSVSIKSAAVHQPQQLTVQFLYQALADD